MKLRKRYLFTAAFLATQAAAPAMAQLSDSPYFNLWTGTANNGDVGNSARLLLCGTATLCNGDINASDNTVGAGYAIFTALEKNTGKGSGAIDPFLRFQHNEGPANGNATTEAAFNTSNNDIGKITNPNSGVTFANQAKDVNAGKDFNHAIKLSDLVLDADGYYTFRLDINEPGGFKSQLRLDELQFFVAGNDQFNKYTMDTTSASTATGMLYSPDGGTAAKKVWDMDFNKINTAGVGFKPAGVQSAAISSASNRFGGINLDNINDSGPAGSGDFDMAVRLHGSLFTTAASGMGENAYVYLYNFAGEADPGNKDLGEAQAGFEEWAADVAPSAAPPPPPGVPEPSTAFLMGAGLIGILRGARARR